MGARRSLTFLAALLAASGGLGLAAQGGGSPYSFATKIRAGLVGGDLQASHSDNKVMGSGVEAKCQMFANGGGVSAEFTWEVVPGRHYDITNWANTGPLVMEPYWSWDNRKERGEGFSLRAAYYAPVPVFGPSMVSGLAKRMEWFGGIGIDRYKVTSEFEWTLFDQSSDAFKPPYRGGVANLPLYPAGGGTFHEVGGDISVGVFAGARCRINSDLAFEVALRNFGMKHYSFTPGAYLGFAPGDYVGRDAGKLDTGGSSRGTSIEFALCLKL
jgi:hypothetical protein